MFIGLWIPCRAKVRRAWRHTPRHLLHCDESWRSRILTPRRRLTVPKAATVMFRMSDSTSSLIWLPPQCRRECKRLANQFIQGGREPDQQSGVGFCALVAGDKMTVRKHTGIPGKPLVVGDPHYISGNSCPRGSLSAVECLLGRWWETVAARRSTNGIRYTSRKPGSGWPLRQSTPGWIVCC